MDFKNRCGCVAKPVFCDGNLVSLRITELCEVHSELTRQQMAQRLIDGEEFTIGVDIIQPNRLTIDGLQPR